MTCLIAWASKQVLKPVADSELYGADEATLYSRLVLICHSSSMYWPRYFILTTGVYRISVI